METMVLIAAMLLVCSSMSQDTTLIEGPGIIEFRTEGSNSTFYIKSNNMGDCRWDFDDGDNRRCCYASPGQPELCSGKNQSEGCKQGSDLKVNTTTEEEKTVCWLTLHNLTVTDTGNYGAVVSSSTEEGFSFVLSVFPQPLTPSPKTNPDYVTENIEDGADICWGWEVCSPEFWDSELIGRDEEKCGHCPKRNISTWKNEDVEFNVLFENSSALVQFSLENMNSVGWMDFVDLEVQVDRYKTVYKAIPIDDFNIKQQKVTDLKLKDRVCLVFSMVLKKEPLEQKLCEVYGLNLTEPSTWQPKDIELSVSCNEKTAIAKVTFNLIRLERDRWMDVLTPIFIHSDDSGNKSLSLPPKLSPGEVNIKGLKPGSNNRFCLNFMEDSIQTASLCHGQCPAVAASWDNWVYWGRCSRQCGGGKHTRYRDCNEAQYGGSTAICTTMEIAEEDCNTHNCPVDASWTSWGSWGSCSRTCDWGTHTRYRDCNVAKYGGSTSICTSGGSETQDCYERECPRCTGHDNGCCTASNPCKHGEGDCDSNDDCSGSLTCGDENCQARFSHLGTFDKDDDCCV